ncbi:hypothetical protein [Streptomyces sp. NPDC051677]|uniref:hypothetical protein n=1 Tax=Streptomyces sp. NPDC051677 TaxID=3365669 RepID=UPI0037D501E5
MRSEDFAGSSRADPLDRFHSVLDLGVIAVEGVDEPHLPVPDTPESPRVSAGG